MLGTTYAEIKSWTVKWTAILIFKGKKKKEEKDSKAVNLEFCFQGATKARASV